MIKGFFKLVVNTGWGIAVSACGAAVGNAMYEVGRFVLEQTLFKKDIQALNEEENNNNEALN